MTRLIANISNYPFSDGQTAADATLLTNGSFRIRDKSLGRQLSDLLELSKDINFFGRSGDVEGRWYDLLSRSQLLQVAKLTSTDTNGLFNFFRDLPLLNGFTADRTLSLKELEILAYQRFQMVSFLFDFYRSVVENSTPVHREQLLAVVKSHSVKNLMSRYIALYEECMTTSPALVKADGSYAISFSEGISFPVLTAEVQSGLRNFYLEGAAVNQASPLLSYQGKKARLKAANEIAGTIFKGLLQVHRSISAWSAGRLAHYACQDPSNEPDIALLLAFVKLQQLYDHRFNKLAYTQSEYIFKEVLQLERQPEKPDTAWVGLELAKNIGEFHLPAQSLFKAGKNKVGKPVYYRTSEDIVLNPATIGRIYSMVRLWRDGQLSGVSATDEANHPQWQVNDAWLPFNDISPSYSGLAVASRLLGLLTRKDDTVTIEISFAGAYAAGRFDLASECRLSVAQEDGAEKFLVIEEAAITGGPGTKLTISAKAGEDLKTLKKGINTRLRFLSPGKTDTESFVALYRYLTSAAVSLIKVKAKRHSYVPEQVKTAGGVLDNPVSFPAFGATSRAGSSFAVVHPLLEFATTSTLLVEWSERLQSGISVSIDGEENTGRGEARHQLKAGNSSEIAGIGRSRSGELSIRLNRNVTYTIGSRIVKAGEPPATVSTVVPGVLIIKAVSLVSDLEETVYSPEPRETGRFVIDPGRLQLLTNGLYMPYRDKTRQKKQLSDRVKKSFRDLIPERKQNPVVWLYPLGEQPVSGNSRRTLLPGYRQGGFGAYEAELCIGLQNVKPGQSISLLFEIADETAELTEREARISWFTVENNRFVPLENGKLRDGTAGFLQSGLVQLSLPESINGDNTILYGDNIYWLVARCEANSDVVANIRKIRTNGVALTRVIDEHNGESRASVEPGTIESLYPKNAFIKSVNQDLPSRNGREAETDERFWRRSSERLRHKNRAVNQWDWEAMVLENFPFVYKVKCFNHARYEESSGKLLAKPGCVLITLLPNYAAGRGTAGLQPALQLSKLLEVKSFLAKKASAFTHIQVLNAYWDEVKADVEIVLADNVNDLPFYRQQLNLDIGRYLAPWAFDSGSTISAGQALYFSALADYLDELPYVHHIVSMKVFKNEVEQYDQVSSSSELHLLTSATDHKLSLKLYADQ